MANKKNWIKSTPPLEIFPTILDALNKHQVLKYARFSSTVRENAIVLEVNVEYVVLTRNMNLNKLSVIFLKSLKEVSVQEKNIKIKSLVYDEELVINIQTEYLTSNRLRAVAIYELEQLKKFGFHS